MTRYLLSCLLASVFFFSPVSICFSQDDPELLSPIDIPSSPNPVGSGARALGMGGAFIAVADDATAASWNPGGLVQLEAPELSVVYDAFYRVESNHFGNSPAASGEETVNKGSINYLSAAWPFRRFNRNMIISLNYQRLYDFTRQWDFPLNTAAAGLELNQNVHYRQEGGLSAIGLAYSTEIISQLSFGFTLNLWDDDLSPNSWETRIFQSGAGMNGGERFDAQSLTDDQYAFEGINANFGILWIVNPHLTLGAVLKTPFKADLYHEHDFKTAMQFPELPKFSAANGRRTITEETLEMPMSYGIGAAWRPVHNFMVSFDLYRTEWDEFVLEEGNGRRTSPLTGKTFEEAGVDPTHQVRIGAEYLHITNKFIFPLTAGIFYDPEPGEGSPDDIYGFGLGTGVGYGRFHFDVAYQYRTGRDVGGVILEGYDFSQDLEEHTVYLSAVIHL